MEAMFIPIVVLVMEIRLINEERQLVMIMSVKYCINIIM